MWFSFFDLNLILTILFHSSNVFNIVLSYHLIIS
ncbi:hypothetical protein CoNPh26_CDS0095 [Staphylococcus phage S-CoN_Ph26]|nr:hypothetical protein CoNPh26_CDS0095 [Staphylococcus phage S-CoN_Ph26]